MKTQSNYSGSRRYDEDNHRENRSDRGPLYDSNYRSSENSGFYNRRFPEDIRGYSDAPSQEENYHRPYNSYNSDTHHDSDAYNYRNSGGYGVENNYDRSGLYNGNARRNDDRTERYSSHWPQDRDYRRTSESYNNTYNRSFDNSRYARDNHFSHYNENNDDQNEGYNGRNASDYTTRYGDRHYDPSENYSRRDERGYTYRHDEDYERESSLKDNGRYSWGREDKDSSKGDYGYYQSYPSYGQPESYGDHERYSGKTSSRSTKTDEYGETDTDHRYTNVRDRRSW